MEYGLLLLLRFQRVGGIMSENTVKWHPYPKEKPKCADEYLVTINCGYFNTTSTSDWKEGKFTDYENEPQKIGSIIAWAEMPEPYKEDL